MTEPIPTSHKRISFDPTINLGHILTFVSLVVAGFAAWSALNTRVAVLEEARAVQATRDASQDQLIRERIVELLAVIGRLEARMERLTDRIEHPKK